MNKYRVQIKYKTKSGTSYTNTSVTKESENEQTAIYLAVNEVLNRTNVVEAFPISSVRIEK